MDTTPRTRLSPGSPWIGAAADSQPPRDGAPSVPPRLPGQPTSRPDRLPPQPIPGVEVSEIDSDTAFDRLFGHLPAAPTRRR